MVRERKHSAERVVTFVLPTTDDTTAADFSREDLMDTAVTRRGIRNPDAYDDAYDPDATIPRDELIAMGLIRPAVAVAVPSADAVPSAVAVPDEVSARDDVSVPSDASVAAAIPAPVADVEDDDVTMLRADVSKLIASIRTAPVVPAEPVESAAPAWPSPTSPTEPAAAELARPAHGGIPVIAFDRRVQPDAVVVRPERSRARVFGLIGLVLAGLALGGGVVAALTGLLR